MSALDVVAKLYPFGVDPDPELRRAVQFLELDATPEVVVRAVYGIGVLGAILTVAIAALAPRSARMPATVLAAVLTLSGVLGGHALPRTWATARRIRSVGDASDLVARVVLSMRLAPAPERAAAFAASAGTGALAANLDKHVDRARRTSTDALTAFGAEWEPWFPSLRRSLELVAAAAEMPASDREQALDRSLTVVLDGLAEQLRTFGARIRGPVTALYAFGVLLPTALVALLPAAGAAGVGITLPVVVGLYDVLLPGVLVVAAGWILAHRPVAFPPPNVTGTHPDVTNKPGVTVAGGLLAGAIGGGVAGVALPAWASIVAVIGFGVGTGLWLSARPTLVVYERVRAVEDGLTDALTFVGRRVANGQSVESAIEQTGRELSGEIGDVFAETARRQRRLQVGVRDAFVGEYGPVATVPSSRVRGSVVFLSHAATEGKPAGSAILALAEHVDELRGVEADARHELGSICRSLRSTGAVFGPLVAGATVALANGMTTAELPGGSGSIPWLGLAVGWYALVLAAILPALATGLVRGLDRALVSARVGRSLVVATLVYLGAYGLVGAIA